MRILLIRHGPSACAPPATFLDRAGVARWRAEHDAAGIAPNESPPPALVEQVAHADVAAASDLPRAVASATRLWPGRSVVLSPLFREIPLRIPSLDGLRMPLAVWELVIHVQWGLDVLSGRADTAEVRQRVDAAAVWCQRACSERGPAFAVAVVTHGVFRRTLARQLVLHGWKMSSRRRSYAPWSVWLFERTAGDSGPPATERGG